MFGTGVKTVYRLLLLSLISLILVACGLVGGGNDLEIQEAQQAQIRQLRLECLDECRRRGQCGATDAGQPIVLGHTQSPHTFDHDILFETGTVVFELQSQFRSATSPSGERLEILFHEVGTQDGLRTGWVAGWCVTDADN